MKTSISITGQTGGNFTLKNAIETLDCEVAQHFNNFTLTFNSKKEAIKALSDGYQHLFADREDWNASTGSYRRGMSLSYDASAAKLEVNS
ncbi:hypothetical protein LCGC14_0337580 [marine sediment metagenome]|uniref:Uncharacterized protein n=1 Tax=marine sediment metagenome TaxID=412755 RepID=A0A0F9W213_9ZZZZ